jgi:protein phosphatase
VDINKCLIEALFKAHNVIKTKAKSDLKLMGMGTTIIEVVIKDNKAYVCHVGDSRVYLIGNSIKRITKDHTVGDYLVEHDTMKREAVPAEKWHSLTQAVGTSETLIPEINTLDLKAEDLLLLCSDGLTDMLADAEIEKIIKQNKADIEKAVRTLVRQANKKGGRDNISVILIQNE